MQEYISTETLYNYFLESKGKVSTDTRKLVPGSIFFALSGTNFNGNQFALQAVKEGCKFAVIDGPEYN
jgi:UDP-N-acetylmuramoyl-tripeptide--D-alanyl-D-alanine ligase